MSAGTLHFGPAGWSYDDWKGIVYPERQGGGFHPLPFLARYVNLVEVNATFYAPLPGAVAASWVRRVAEFPDFRFVIKAWERFSHHGDDLPARGEAASWAQVLAPLAEASRLLAVLFQLPHYEQDSAWNRDRILRVREALGPVPLACEFRHRSWDSLPALDWMKGEGLTFVNIDQPQGHDTLPPTEHVTAPLAYARLHGRNAAAWFNPRSGRDARYDHHYTDGELREWAPRIASMRERAATTILVGNNHYHGKALAAVLSLVNLLTGETLPVPDRMLERYPELQPIRAPEPGSLF